MRVKLKFVLTIITILLLLRNKYICKVVYLNFLFINYRIVMGGVGGDEVGPGDVCHVFPVRNVHMYRLP